MSNQLPTACGLRILWSISCMLSSILTEAPIVTYQKIHLLHFNQIITDVPTKTTKIQLETKLYGRISPILLAVTEY